MLRRIRRGLTESKNQSVEEDVTASPKQYDRLSAPPNLFIISKMRRSLCDVDAEYTPKKHRRSFDESRSSFTQ